MVLALLALGGWLLLGRGGPPPGVPVVPTVTSAEDAEPLADPFAYLPERGEELAERAAFGVAHPLYANSPGGAVATAARTAAWRAAVERAARHADVDPDRLEGLVFLESAGRPDAVAPNGFEGAVGLTQILAETGQNLLGMRVDADESRRLTRRMDRARRRGQDALVERLGLRRRRVDERFDPDKALAAAGRYLKLARDRFGREDLAFVSYHMGIGNLESVLRDFSRRQDDPIGDVVADEELDWPRIYFDSTPRRHRRAYRRLAGFGDDSSNYFWKVEAASEIMRLWRADRAELVRTADLQTAKASAEEVLHPASRTERFRTPQQLRDAWDDGDIRAVPDDPAATGLDRHRGMGELADRIDQPPGLYRGLRPEALALALYIGAQVRDLSGSGALTVTSTVRDDAYQAALITGNREATHRYSLHTTGWALDIARVYDTRRQALAFQWVLDRLGVLGVIAWVREPHAIHMTVSEDADVLLPLLERLQDE